MDYNVGASILGVITESLYDNPIVVFREYVQNSVDSIIKTDKNEYCEIRIWWDGTNLFFIDNGHGVDRGLFIKEMIKIGSSSKKRQSNLGYKGIGRLSGVPYCQELLFINIYDYAQDAAQLYSIDGVKYNAIKEEDTYNSLSFEELMQKIGSYRDIALSDINSLVKDLTQYDYLLKTTNTGFVVVLKNVKEVLSATINDDSFITDLEWLLPVDFLPSLYESNETQLFKDLTDKEQERVPVRFCNIYYNDRQLYRPIKQEMLRDYVCKSNFSQYAVGFHSFKSDKISIERNNPFQGIRIYIDNMLLCDESVLIQSLANYGLLSHTINGQLQSIRGLGAMIYITDKTNIRANARRTFLEVTDNDSIAFLRLLAEFVNTVYDTRYALSNYFSFKQKHANNGETLKKLRQNAIDNLKKLASETISLPDEGELPLDSDNETDKKYYLKKRIGSVLDKKIKQYLEVVTNYDIEKAYYNFIEWLNKNLD